MPTKERMVHLKYNVYVGAKDSKFDIYSHQFDTDARNQLKKQLKHRIGDYISQQIDSVGNTHLPKEQTPEENTNKGFLLGKRGGKICSNKSESFVYDLVLLTVVDGKDANKKDKIHKSVKKSISEYQFEHDLTGIIGVLSENPTKTFEVRATEPKAPYGGRKGFGGYKSENLTSTVPRDVKQDFDIVDEISSQGTVTDPVEVTSEASDYEDIIQGFDIDPQLEAIKQDYNDEAFEVRKPSKKETERIVDALIDRFEQISQQDENIYFKEHPEFWDEVSCSMCRNEDAEVYKVAKDRMKSIFMQQMKQGFGIADRERRQQPNRLVSNFYVNRNGEVFFRPEEIISWIIDFMHKVEPFCKDCHSQVGGSSGHIELRQNSKTDQISKEKPGYQEITDNSRTTESDNGRDIQLEIASDTDSVQIQTDDNVQDAQWDVYRKPRPSEAEEIIVRILRHIYSLGTRAETGHDGQIQGIYKVTLKRGPTENGDSFDSLECKSCDKDLDNLKRHHPVLLRLREAHMDIINSLDIPVEESPILVNEDRNEFILSHKFLWRIESHIKNLDTAAFMCSGCSSDKDIQHVSNRDELNQQTLTDTTTQQLEKKEIKDILINLTRDADERKHTFECPKCKMSQGNRSTITCYRTQNNQYEVKPRYKTPVLKPQTLGIESQQIKAHYIGLCTSHMRGVVEMIWAEDPVNEDEVTEQFQQSIRSMI